jgi:hypothetical protein
MNERDEECSQNLVRKSEVKRWLRRLGDKWKGSARMELQRQSLGVWTGFIKLGHCSLVPILNTIMGFLNPYKVSTFAPGWAIVYLTKILLPSEII